MSDDVSQLPWRRHLGTYHTPYGESLTDVVTAGREMRVIGRVREDCAYLVAAAPELLMAVRALLANDNDAATIARLAVFKAEGKGER